MKIGIIGSGTVGQTLAKAFTSEGNEVMIGSRDELKMKDFGKENNIATGTFENTAKFGELLVVCTKGDGAKHALHLAGEENLENKIIIDTTNPIAGAPKDGVLNFSTTFQQSLMEELQETFPNAKFVKAFNSVGSAIMYKPDYKGTTPTMFICGNDDKAKKTVTDILTSFGYEAADMGKATSARAVEPLCILWCIPGFLQNQWTHAFKLLKM